MSIKKNFFYSSILTTSNYIFPLITYPYVSRVLGVSNIGLYNFADSIINYFSLFSMLGISIIGIREIAATQNDAKKCNQTFSSLFFMNILFTSIALIFLIGAIYTIPELQRNEKLMHIGILKLISNTLLIDWFYKGLEKFRYITNITLIIKILYVISVFIFIKEPDDYIMYYLLCTLMITINAIANGIYALKYVRISLKEINIRKYIKTNIVLGMHALLTSMYSSFNIAYLGFITNSTEVGYYTTGTKLFTIIIAIYTAFTGVLQPRMSILLAENKKEEFISLIHKSITILLTMSIPIIIFSCILTSDIIYIISGSGYEGATIPTQIIMPLIFIIGYEQILVIQVLTPLKKDKAILINSIIGAITGIGLNIAIVKELLSIGSAIVWLSSELIVLISAQYFVTQYTEISFPFKQVIKEILIYIPLAALLLTINIYRPTYNPYLTLLLTSSITLLYIVLVKKRFITFIIKKQL